MSWPEAFAIVGGGICVVAFFWVLLRGSNESEGYVPPSRRRPPVELTMWKSTTTTRMPVDREFMPGWTLERIAANPDEYVEAVRKAYPKPPRKA